MNSAANTASETAALDPNTLASYLVKMGGREWIKAGKHRIYIAVDMACKAINLRCQFYGSGNVSSATLDGDKISNCSARDMRQTLSGMYYDVQIGKFVGSYYGAGAALRARAEQMAAE